MPRPLHLPIIHMNGTPRRMIVDQLQEALDAIVDATEKVQACAPNQRDYYIGPPEAWLAALTTHAGRLAALAKLYNDLTDDARTLVDEKG